jgi:hypothetical protein
MIKHIPPEQCPLCLHPTNHRREGWLVLTFGLGLLMLLSASDGCKQLQAVWPAVIECTASAGAPVADVERIVMQDGQATALSIASRDQLESLAVTWGADVIACILEQLIDQWLAPGQTVIPRANAMAARRAQLFLSQHDSHPSMKDPSP